MVSFFIILLISFSFCFIFLCLLILDLFPKELLLIYLRRIQIMTLVVTTLHQYLKRKCKYIHACTCKYSRTTESVGNLGSSFSDQFMKSCKMEGETTLWQFTVSLNNMGTLKFKAQSTNVFFVAVNRIFGGSSQLLTTAEHCFRCLNCA